MAKKKKKSRKLTKNIELNKLYYDELGSEDIYSGGVRGAKVFAAKEKRTGELSIRALSKSKRPYGWKENLGFSIFNVLHLNKFISALRKFANKLGWQIPDEADRDMEKTKQKIRDQQELIANLQKDNKEAKVSYEKLLDAFEKQKEKLLRSRIDEFKVTVKELKQKIEDAKSKKIPESELQQFLHDNTWLLGTDYINAEPQKMRGTHSIFDFYLERFNKTKDIVEIKLLSDRIINTDGSISAKVIQAVDQIIEYLESSIAAAHSLVISQEEGISELRPKGVVIIGNETSKEATEKLCKWNYRLTHIKILTYSDIVKKAEAVLSHIEAQID